MRLTPRAPSDVRRVLLCAEVVLRSGCHGACRAREVRANKERENRLVWTDPLQFGQDLESFSIWKVDGDDHQIPRLAERQIETFRPSLAFRELRWTEFLRKDLPDASSYDSIIVKDEDSQLRARASHASIFLTGHYACDGGQQLIRPN